MADTKISALPAATTPLDGTEVIPLVQSGATKKVANNDLRPKQIQSNATSGVLQVTGPTASQTRVMTTPDADFSAARTDAGQTFLGQQTLIEDATNATPITLGSNGGIGDSTQILYQPRQAFLAPIAATKGVVTYGAGGNESGDYFIETTSGGVRTSKLRVESIGNIYALVGNFVPATAGSGINFTANTPAAGMTSQLLNDYEEGTWTTGAGNLTVVGTFSSTGTYTKIGRLVTATIELRGSTSIEGAAGQFFGALPFTPARPSAGVLVAENRGQGCQVEVYTNGYVYVTGFSATSAVYVTVQFEVS